MNSQIYLSLATSSAAIAEAQKFIVEKYRLTFQTTPSLPHALITATQGGRVIGTIGIETCDNGQSLRLESIYRFNHSTLPFSYVRRYMMEYGRWIADIPRISGPLLFAASSYAASIGKQFGLCEHTNRVHRAAQRLGIEFHPVPDAELCHDNIPEADLSFYTTGDPSTLYMVRVEQVREAMRGATEKLLESGQICIDRQILGLPADRLVA